MKAVTLKLGTHMDKWLMYSVYQNQHQGSITLRVTYLDRFYNLPFTGPRSLVDKRVDSESIRFLTAVVRASLGSYVGKPSSAYGWSGGFSLGSPVFTHL